MPGEAPSWLSDSAYARFDKSPLPPDFPLRPKSAVLPIEALATAAAGLGHTSLAYDRDGAPRYDYAALPFEADFLPSLPIRAAAAYLGVAWPQVALALGAGVRIGDLTVPTDRAMRLLINYRGPPRTFPSFSFADLLAGRVAADQLVRPHRPDRRLVRRQRRQLSSALRQHADAGGRAHRQHHRYDHQSRFHQRALRRLGGSS